MTKVICWFIGPNWGREENIRRAEPVGIVALFLPILFFSHYGLFKECDKKCIRCGEIKTFSYNGTMV